jgi:hypothetical protein
MNLHIEFDGVDQEVYQTPTYITYMCLMGASGINSEVTSNKAIRAVNCYLEYVRGMSFGQEIKAYQQGKYAHIKAVTEALNKAKSVVVYAM